MTSDYRLLTALAGKVLQSVVSVRLECILSTGLWNFFAMTAARRELQIKAFDRRQYIRRIRSTTAS